MLTLVGQELFVFVFGEHWTESGIYIQILAIWMFFYFISSPLSTIFTIFERQELALVVHVAIFITHIITLVIGGILNDVYLALGLFAGSGVLVYGSLAIWNILLADVSVYFAFRTLVRYAFYSAPAIVILLLLKIWLRTPTEIILVVSGAALLAYYALIILNDNVLHDYLLTRVPTMLRFKKINTNFDH
jgi:lipopolysaccharide exporter